MLTDDEGRTPDGKRVQYAAANLGVLARVPLTAKYLLDVGCGTGALGKLIKDRQDCVIVGVTHDEEEREAAANVIDTAILADLENFDFNDLGPFDCVICSHVLEHVSNPVALLKRIGGKLKKDGIVIVALPNALLWKQRLQFLLGKFRYARGGLMDETHLRFFDWQTSSQLLKDAGYSILERTAEGTFPQPLRKLSVGIARTIDVLACSWLPGVFGWQFILVAVPTAT